MLRRNAPSRVAHAEVMVIGALLDANGDPRLVAGTHVIDGVADEVREEILAFSRANLAKYKVPKNIHLIDTIPLTGAGKVDKKVLRAIAVS